MYVKRFLRLQRLKAKQLGIIYFLPIIIVLCVMPMVFIYQIRNIDLFYYEAYQKCLRMTQLIIPFAGSFGLVFQLEEWTEKGKRELYYLHESRPVKIAFLYMTFYHMGVFVTYLFYEMRLEGFFYEYFRIFAACVFFQGIALILSFAVKNQYVSIFVLFLYTLCCSFEERFNKISYIVSMPTTQRKDYWESAIWLIAGILFMTAASSIERINAKKA